MERMRCAALCEDVHAGNALIVVGTAQACALLCDSLFIVAVMPDLTCCPTALQTTWLKVLGLLASVHITKQYAWRWPSTIKAFTVHAIPVLKVGTHPQPVRDAYNSISMLSMARPAVYKRRL
jgi:hypothetical protein